MAEDTGVSRETWAQHQAYIALLLKWTDTIALVSRSERNLLALQRQVAASCLLAPLLIPGQARFLDLGSGNGLPAIPLVIETGRSAELVEADRRKAAFLRHAAAHLHLDVTVTTERIETLPGRLSPCIVAKALAPLPRLLPLIGRHLAPDGVAFLVKGLGADRELIEAERDWTMTVERLQFGDRTTVLKISHLSRRGSAVS